MSTTVVELKDACLALSDGALSLFDGLEEHGLEAPWEDADALAALMGASDAFFVIREFFQRQATLRMASLSPAALDRLLSEMQR